MQTVVQDGGPNRLALWVKKQRPKAQQKATGGGDAKMFTCWFNTAFVGGPR